MKRKILQVFSVAAFAATLASPLRADTNPPAAPKPDRFTELFGDAVVAKGSGLEIKRSQLDASVIRIKATGVTRGQVLTPEQAAMLERQVLEQMMEVRLLLNRATDADKAKAKELGGKRYDQLLKRNGSVETLNRQLKALSMTAEELRNEIIEKATAETVVEREVKTDITDADAKKFYDENPARFEEPEMVRVSHILLGTRDIDTGVELSEERKQAKRKQLEDILKRARAGADFAKLADEFSEDPAVKDNHGEYKFSRDDAFVAEFKSAAFSLETNHVSDIITTQFGYHILKLSEKIPAHKIELAKVADRIKELLKMQEQEKQMPAYIEKLKAEAKVEVLDERLKQAGEKLAAAKAAEAARQKSGDDKK